MSKGDYGKVEVGTSLGINFGTTWKMDVTSRTDPICLRYSLNGRLGGPQNEKRKVTKKPPLVEFNFSIQIIITNLLPKLGKCTFNPLILMLFVLCIFSNVVIFTSTGARTA
jgi:hypothetical protein